MLKFVSAVSVVVVSALLVSLASCAQETKEELDSVSFTTHSNTKEIQELKDSDATMLIMINEFNKALGDTNKILYRIEGKLDNGSDK